MAYAPTTWNTGDIITAEKLNKLEKGVQNEQVGPQGPKGDAGAQGPEGPKGDTGAAGAAAGFGTPTASASVLEAGASPTVSVQASGADTAKVFTFTFGIPKGAQGDPGPKGDKGDQGAQGPAGPGLTGSAVAVADLAGTEEAAAICTKVNEILAQLRARGVIATG